MKISTEYRVLEKSEDTFTIQYREVRERKLLGVFNHVSRDAFWSNLKKWYSRQSGNLIFTGWENEGYNTLKEAQKAVEVLKIEGIEEDKYPIIHKS
jgi:hypothetical protein